MQNNVLSFCYAVKPISFEKLNDNFTKMKCYVLALGKNRNRSYIGLDAVQASLPSLKNIPVVAHLKKRDDGGFYVGSHDRQIIIDDNGITLNDLTVPFGVVPENNNPEYVEVTESDGTVVTYLTCEILLWTQKYSNIMEAIYSDEVYFNQSMEINCFEIEPLEEDKNYQNIKSFEFSALCILGRSDDENYHSEPCFPSAKIEPINYNLNVDNFKTEFTEMMSQLKELAFSINSNSSEGGDTVDEKLELLKSYNLTVDSIDFEIEDLSIDELKVKIEEFMAKQNAQSNNDDSTGELSFSATYNQKRDALQNALDPIIKKDSDGNVTYEEYRWIADFDDQYVFVEKSIWTDNNHERLYGRYTYSFDETELTATVTGEFEEMVLVWLTKEENQKIQDDKQQLESSLAEIKSEFDTYKETYKTPETDVDELRSFKNEKLESEHNDQLNEIFSKYEEKLADSEEFKLIRENTADKSVEDIEKECALLFAQKELKFSAKPQANKNIKIPVHTPTHDEELYGGLFSVYKKSKIN